jgi:hypothetical protein
MFQRSAGPTKNVRVKTLIAIAAVAALLLFGVYKYRVYCNSVVCITGSNGDEAFVRPPYVCGGWFSED